MDLWSFTGNEMHCFGFLLKDFEVRLWLIILLQVNSSGVMPIIFASWLLALPASAARFSGLAFLKDEAVVFYPNGM